MKKYIPGQGSSSPKIIVVGEFPTSYEERNDAPFQGPHGRLHDSFLQKVGIGRSEVYHTYVVKYRPPDDNIKRLKEVGITDIEKQCIPQLLEEIAFFKECNVIIASGELALKYLTGNKNIIDWRGSILSTATKHPGLFKKVIPIFNPQSFFYPDKKKTGIIRVPWAAKVYTELDYKRVREESTYPELRLPNRNLQIARNSHMLWQFFDRYSDRTKYKKCSIDIEVIKCIPIAVSFAFTKDHAISVPLLNIQGNKGNIQIPEYELAQMWKLCAEVMNDPLLGIIGQNFKFDHDKLYRVCGFRIAKVLSDTMLKAHALHAELPKSLGFTASIYTREPFYKNEGKEFNPARDHIDKFLTYNARDAAVTFEVDEEMEKAIDALNLHGFYYDYLMELHKLYLEIESTGFKMDSEKRKEVIEKYTKWDKDLYAELKEIIKHDINLNSPTQVKRLLFDELEIPERADTSEETLCALLANTVTDSTKKRVIEIIYQIRRVRLALKNVKAKPDYDGRMRTAISIAGTETGRSTTGTIDAPVRPDEMGFPFQLISKHGDFGTDMRYFYVADDGCLFQNFDLSQAEARIVALLSEDWDTLKAFDTIDIHAQTASWVFGGKYEDHCKQADGTEPPTRFGGKTIRHAGNYDMGKRTLMLDTAKKARRFHININMSEKDAEKCLRLFHNKAPKIRGVFHESVKKALTDGQRVLYNGYGRRRIFLAQAGNDLWREAYAFIPQSMVADHMKKAILRIKKRIPWLQIIVEAHDAILTQSKIDRAEEVREVVREEFEKPLPFEFCSLKRQELIIPCDVEAGYNYKELKKVKKKAA
jgi:uracil-DNA glycosylase family 4